MKEVEMLKKLHSLYQKICSVCGDAKHIQNFKRQSKFRKVCNSCYIRNGESPKNDRNFDKAFALMDQNKVEN